LTDNPERRKRRDDSRDVPGKYLSSEIHRRLSEASSHPKEQEKEEAAQEGPNRGYLNEEVHRKLSEASRRDERINQPVDTMKTGGIDAETEHSVAQKEEERLPENPDVMKQTTQGAQQEGTGEHADSSEQPLKGNLMPRELNSQSEDSGRHEQTERPAEAKRTDDMDTKPEKMGEQKDPMVRQIYEIQGHESRLPEKAPEQLLGKEGQRIPETQTEKTREPQVEQPDFKPPLSGPMPHESSSKLKGRESASEYPLEQDLTAQDKLSHEHLTDGAHEKPSERSQPSDITRKDGMDARSKSEQSITPTEPTVNRSLDRPDHESRLQEQLVRTEERRTNRETQPEKGREFLVEKADHAKEPLQIDHVPHELDTRSERKELASGHEEGRYHERPVMEPHKHAFCGRMPNEGVSDVGGIRATVPEKTFDWAKLFEDASVVEKVSSESWARSFVKEIKDYQKLDQIGEGETEIQGLNINMEKGIVQRGDPGSIGKSYFNLKILDTGTIIRVYEDNAVTVWDGYSFKRLRIEQLDSTNTEPLEIVTRGETRSGTDLTTILMRDYLENIGFFDKFVIGQEVEAFGVKGTVKEKGESTHSGPYVTLEYNMNEGKSVEVTIDAQGPTVYNHRIIDVEIGEDGAVNLIYEHGDRVIRCPIKLPEPLVKTSPVSMEIVGDKMDLDKTIEDLNIKADFETIKKETGIQSPQDFTDTVAYAMDGKTIGDFRETHDLKNWEKLRDSANSISKYYLERELEMFGLKNIEADIEAGVEPVKPGDDIKISTSDGTQLKVDIEYAGSGKKCYSAQVDHLMKKFAKGTDLGIIFWEGEYHIFVNLDTEYMPLRDLARGSKKGQL